MVEPFKRVYLVDCCLVDSNASDKIITLGTRFRSPSFESISTCPILLTVSKRLKINVV